MVRPMLRSRSKRRVFVKLPGNTTKLTYPSRRKPSQPVCAGCGKILHGIIRARSFVMKRLPQSAKTVSRPYGGSLCSACSRAKHVSSVLGGGA